MPRTRLQEVSQAATVSCEAVSIRDVVPQPSLSFPGSPDGPEGSDYSSFATVVENSQPNSLYSFSLT